METFVIILEFVVIPVIAVAVAIALFARRKRNDGGGS
jgi:hypothetical protein